MQNLKLISTLWSLNEFKIIIYSMKYIFKSASNELDDSKSTYNLKTGNVNRFCFTWLFYLCDIMFICAYVFM